VSIGDLKVSNICFTVKTAFLASNWHWKKCSDILSMTLAHTCHRNMYTSISEKIQQEIISKVGNVCAFYNIVLIEMKIARNEYGGLFALEPLVTAYQ
jgi:hypothetical protein